MKSKEKSHMWSKRWKKKKLLEIQKKAKAKEAIIIFFSLSVKDRVVAAHEIEKENNEVSSHIAIAKRIHTQLTIKRHKKWFMSLLTHMHSAHTHEKKVKNFF